MKNILIEEEIEKTIKILNLYNKEEEINFLNISSSFQDIKEGYRTDNTKN